MSLFKGERVFPLAVHYQPRTIGVGENPGDGVSWYDASQLTLYTKMNGVQAANQQVLGVNVTAQTATNPSSTSNLMSVALPANTMNVVGKTIRIKANGVYNVQGTPTLTFNVGLGATGVLSFISGATTNAAVNMPWDIVADITTLTAGTSGAVVSGGKAAITLGTNAALATTTYMNIPAGNTAFNCQSVGNVTVSVLSSTNNVNTVVVQQFMEVEIGN